MNYNSTYNGSVSTPRFSFTVHTDMVHFNVSAILNTFYYLFVYLYVLSLQLIHTIKSDYAKIRYELKNCLKLNNITVRIKFDHLI